MAKGKRNDRDNANLVKVNSEFAVAKEVRNIPPLRGLYSDRYLYFIGIRRCRRRLAPTSPNPNLSSLLAGPVHPEGAGRDPEPHAGKLLYRAAYLLRGGRVPLPTTLNGPSNPGLRTRPQPSKGRDREPSLSCPGESNPTIGSQKSGEQTAIRRQSAAVIDVSAVPGVHQKPHQQRLRVLHIRSPQALVRAPNARKQALCYRISL